MIWALVLDFWDTSIQNAENTFGAFPMDSDMSWGSVFQWRGYRVFARSSMKAGLPKLPPKVTCRWDPGALSGELDLGQS